MNEVKKCSLSGISFTMDEDAFLALDDYLKSLKATYRDSADGAEIVADIEARIAELILSTQDNTCVVEKPLILNIIRQMGSAEEITEELVDGPQRDKEPRIPRRLYRDTENAKLGGVCAGIGRYFDIDPVWVRLGFFLPLFLSPIGWFAPIMGNLFSIFVICYLVMWFAVPAARSARQKLEMKGERITAQSISETTAATSAADPDTQAKPIIAEAVSLFGKLVLICMKLIAGLIVFGLIMAACGLIIGFFTLLVGGTELLSPHFLQTMGLGVPLSGIVVGLLLVMLLIYVLMCLIASRKPGGKTILAIFILWLVSIFVCATLSIKGDLADRIRERNWESMLNKELQLGDEITTLRELLEESGNGSVIDEAHDRLHISLPEKELEITVDRSQGEMTLNVGGKTSVVHIDEDAQDATIRIVTKAVTEGEAGN